jgi:glycerol-3-phosphate dehydrogenase
MPITREVAAVLFENRPAREAVKRLMERAPKSEWWR